MSTKFHTLYPTKYTTHRMSHRYTVFTTNRCTINATKQSTELSTPGEAICPTFMSTNLSAQWTTVFHSLNTTIFVSYCTAYIVSNSYSFDGTIIATSG